MKGKIRLLTTLKLFQKVPNTKKDYTKDNGTVYAAHEPTDIENTNNSEE